MSIESTLEKYKKIYDLPELKYEETVSRSFFEVCKIKHYFVVIVIHNTRKEFLLIRDFNKTIGWELPGGYINDGERIEEAINRITFRETGLEVDELSPLAVIKNIFKYGGRSVIHYGIAFTALSRGEVKPYPKNLQIYFTNSIQEKIAYQNNKILSIAKEKLKPKNNNPPFEEIDSVKKNFSLFYLFHNHFIKHIGNFSSRKIEQTIFSLIEGKPKTILDASCGESSVINKLYKKYKPDICIGNDISWKAITLIKNKNPAIFFTNHDILNLP